MSTTKPTTDERRVALNVKVPESLHRNLKARAAMEGMTIRAAVNEALSAWVTE